MVSYKKTCSSKSFLNFRLSSVYGMRKLFAKCSDDRERFLRSSETDLKIPLLKTINGLKAFSYRGATVELSRKSY